MYKNVSCLTAAVAFIKLIECVLRRNSEWGIDFEFIKESIINEGREGTMW